MTDHLGTPREVVSERGDLEWAAEFKTWGALNQVWQPGVEPVVGEPEVDYWVNPDVPQSDGALAYEIVEPDKSFCPLRFQGQWADAETGLYYNRFRYYEPSVGAYTSSDPIRLNGGMRIFGYVVTPTFFIDTIGLNGSIARCTQLLADMRRKNMLFKSEMESYDPVLDAQGGFQHAHGTTVPGGHYIEIRALQQGLRNNLAAFGRLRCRQLCERFRLSPTPQIAQDNVNTPVTIPPGIGMPFIPLNLR